MSPVYLYDLLIICCGFDQVRLHLLCHRGRRGRLRGHRGRGYRCHRRLLLAAPPGSLNGRLLRGNGTLLRKYLRGAQFTRGDVEGQCEAAGQPHHGPLLLAVLPALLRRRLDGHGLLGRGRRHGDDWLGLGRRRSWHGHGRGDDGLVGPGDQLDLAALRHHLDGLRALHPLHLGDHLVLDVGRGGGLTRGALDGEQDRTGA